MTSYFFFNFKIPLIILITKCMFLLFISSSIGAASTDKFTEFDWDLTKAVGEEVNKNVILSPISIKILLAMVYEGAQGNTSKQLEQALNLERSSRAYKTETFSEILNSLHKESDEYDLDIGTKLFVDKKTKLNKKYEDRLKSIYNATVDKVEFTNSEETVNTINSWAKYITKGHIKNLISAGDTKDGLSLLLLNAIYFKGQWLQPFSLNETVPGEFILNSTHSVKDIPFMNSIQSQKFYESGSEDLDASIIQLPYMGEKFAMYIVLPNTADGLSQLVKTVTPQILKEHIENMYETQINISLPRFQFDFSSSLRHPLEMLGLKDMFTGKANLSGITTSDDLMVSNIIQKAGIQVNEQGSTAYVASQVDLVSKFGESTVEVIANHPFMFFIEDLSTKTVVFVGKVVNPGTEKSPIHVRSPPEAPKPSLQFQYENVNGPGTYQPILNTIPPNNNMQNNFGTPSMNNQQNEAGQSNNWQGAGFQYPNMAQPGIMQGSIQPEAAGVWYGPQDQSSGMVQPGIYQTDDKRLGTGNMVTPTQQYPSQPPSKDANAGGYYNNDGEYVRQNFNQDRWSFFDTEIMKNFCDKQGNTNWVISPSSIKSILGMIYEGSSGKTEKDIGHMLRLPTNKTSGLRMIHSIQRELHHPAKPNTNVEWIMANRILVSNKLPLIPEYRTHLANLYHARIDQAKFDSPAQTAEDVNNWISNTTKGFIPSLISQDAVDKDAKLMLLNGVYFKSDWLYPFKKRYTQPSCFYPKVDENCVRVNMMKQRSFFKYGLYKELLAHVIELPYADTRFSMVFVLPQNRGGLADVVRDLPKCPLLSFVRDMQTAEVDLSLPSFAAEFSADLTDILKLMGGGSMFSDSADLSGMVGRNNPAKISKILHKAKIIVNEKGTEAGAGTAAIIVPLMNTQLVQLTLDHPFLFFIRDDSSGFLFSGQIVDPSVQN